MAPLSGRGQGREVSGGRYPRPGRQVITQTVNRFEDFKISCNRF
jgi:hypothetical protein